MNKSSNVLNNSESEIDIPNLKLDLEKWLNTRDTFMNTMATAKQNFDKEMNFYSTYTAQNPDVLLTNRKLNKAQDNLKSHRAKKKSISIFQDNSLLFNDTSNIASDKEINEEIMDIDDNLSDVPVKDFNVNQNDFNFCDQSLGIDLHDLSLDHDISYNQDMGSPIRDRTLSASCKSSSQKGNTPSFSVNMIKRDSFNKKRAVNVNVNSKLDFDLPSSRVNFPNLYNIPEVLDESNVWSEVTHEMRLSNKYSSNGNWTSSQHQKRSSEGNYSSQDNSFKRLMNSPDKSLDKLAGALDLFISHKSNNQQNAMFGDAEWLTFSNKKAFRNIMNKLEAEKEDDGFLPFETAENTKDTSANNKKWQVRDRYRTAQRSSDIKNISVDSQCELNNSYDKIIKALNLN